MPKLTGVALLLLVSACGGGHETASDASARTDAAGAHDAATPTNACAFPTEYDTNDAGAPRCTAGRYSWRCDAGGGATEECVSSTASGCTGASACEDQCNELEYAITCGDLSPTSNAELPAGCRSLGATPGGNQLGCCPCQATL